MTELPLDAWAQEICTRHHLRQREGLRRSTHDLSDRLRNLIWEVEHEGRPAVLKVYDDVVNVEAESLSAFHASNRSRMLTAPELHFYETVSPTKGWLLMEKLPDDGRFLESPIADGERERFIALYCEYRRNFPSSPNRPLALAEAQDAYRFHSFRTMQALETASTLEQQRAFDGEPAVLRHDELLPRLEAVMDRVRAVFKGRKLRWGHGHFKPADLFEYPDHRYAITDFGRTKMLPEGYEEALAIWWDQMMRARHRTTSPGGRTSTTGAASCATTPSWPGATASASGGRHARSSRSPRPCSSSSSCPSTRALPARGPPAGHADRRKPPQGSPGRSRRSTLPSASAMAALRQTTRRGLLEAGPWALTAR
jgi:hypothetical protein